MLLFKVFFRFKKTRLRVEIKFDKKLIEQSLLILESICWITKLMSWKKCRGGVDNEK